MEGTRGYVADLLVLPGRLDVADALIDDGLQTLEAAGVAVVQCAIPARHPYDPLLRAHGLVDSGRLMPFGFRGGRPGHGDFLTEPDARVHLMYADGHGI